jgi:hypothetical protein
MNLAKMRTSEVSEDRRRQILEDLDAGKISAEDSHAHFARRGGIDALRNV